MIALHVCVCVSVCILPLSVGVRPKTTYIKLMIAIDLAITEHRRI